MRNLRAQRRRAGELRRRVVASALVAFVVLWAVVFAQMATGNDPVLSGKSSGAVVTTARHRAKSRSAKAEAGASAGTGERVSGGSVGEAIETTDPRQTSGSAVESEVVEAEAEAIEAEPEVEDFVEEPAPVTTSQS